MLQFDPIGLKELCSFTSIQEPEYEEKTKWQLIKIINGKVDTLKEDEGKIEILNNIIGKSKKVTSKPPERGAAMNNDGRKHLSNKQDTGQPIFHNIDIDGELRIIREKEADLIRTKQILEKADQQEKVLLRNNNKRGSISTAGNVYFPF